MKLIGMLFAMQTLGVFAQNVDFIRQSYQGTGVVWDMPVAASAPVASPFRSNSVLFQRWNIQQNPVRESLLHQKLVGNYLPTADIKVVTLDPDGKVPRTRVDQPFSVEIDVAGLLTDSGMPLTSSHVLLEQHLASYSDGQTSLDLIQTLSNIPENSGYLTSNGKSKLKFPASSLKAADPTKALGEEHFVVHTLSDGTISQTQIASGMVQVWPVASGAIKGIANGDIIGFQAPKIELLLNDLYPRSDTFFMLYEGSSVNGTPGAIIKTFPMDREVSASTVIGVTGLESKFTKDGTYTVALVSTTVYGTELLCPPVTFQVKRPLEINAMQVTCSDGGNP